MLCRVSSPAQQLDERINVEHAGQRRSLDKLILDLNSSVSQTYGRRERQP